ncbi:hypothetical protein EHEL_020920 [Encephalitozoon hellem ATCC 50504]|uniref:Activator 1 40 kDa subunit n=1 Tax=Encephalitozoon hellem TaxID=27973 RepID=A0A9Q9C214_ENCHE|nr:uncharacterized protein EHEL_020920 [Encephalitozoon hellem ATCC 50504]AFM97847.1 hypothetical protein EHEL_020920 [Encephalitozoon hellem ATCC 50504]UTX42626.1 activator 1 40 kDa subunit [Encephalitozoon hellem]|eukprot:XP_003886828.1 hypothetical protein EHEL_020920 [Encephalitozoon hellem ATCC 50504]
MDFTTPAKQRELRAAFERIGSTVVVVYGPPGSSKTYSIRKTADSLGLTLEYIEDVGMCRGMLPSRNAVCLTDMDDYEYLARHRGRLGAVRNLVIETRTLVSIGKILPNAIVVRFGKVSSGKIQKFYGLSKEEASAVDGNLHAVGFCKYSVGSEMVSIFHLLGKLFHSKVVNVSKASEMARVHGRDRFFGYVLENCPFFMSMDDVHRLIEGFSLDDLGGEQLERLIWIIVDSEKVETKGFFSFKSFRGIGSEHVCSSLCMNR